MKKLVVTLLTILTCGAVQALPVRNPGEASLFTNGIYCEGNESNDCCDPCFSWCDAWSIRVGFDGNYVFNRHLEVSNDDQEHEIERTSIFTNSGYIALNICDRVDVFATLGETTIDMEFDSSVLNLIQVRALDVLRFDPAFSWSVGARATLWECNCFLVGIEGEYFRTATNLRFHQGAESQLTALDQSLTYSEWQVGLGASYVIATSCPKVAFVPYLAVTWSGAKLDGANLDFATLSATDHNLNQLEQSKLWGFAVGTALTLCDVVGVNVEARFGSEKAVAVNGQFRF